MKRIILAVILLVLVAIPAFGATLPLKGTWTAPTTSADGTALTDLAGYNLYVTSGTRAKLNTTLISATTYNFNFNASTYGTYTFVVTAVDTSGNESVDSDMASYVYADTIAPSKPGSLIIIHQ